MKWVESKLGLAYSISTNSGTQVIFLIGFGLAVGTFFDFLVTRGCKPKKAYPYES